MNAIKDNSRAHIAEMMTQGTVMGITALKNSLSDMSEQMSDNEIEQLAEELLHSEEQFEKNWKNLIA